MTQWWIILLILMLYISLQFYRIHKWKHNICIKKHRIVVSLTTTPGRLKHINTTVASLNNQTMKPDKIYLNVPYKYAKTGESYVIPDELHNNPNLTINYVEKDYGPGTKLLGVLKVEQDPNTMIIIVDDDITYDKDLIKYLYHGSQDHPNSVITFSGSKTINKWSYPTLNLFSPCSAQMFAGFSGALFMRKFINDDVFNYPFVDKACFVSDDCYLSKHVQNNNIQIIVLPLTILGFKVLNLHEGATVNPLSFAESTIPSLTHIRNYRTCMSKL